MFSPYLVIHSGSFLDHAVHTHSLCCRWHLYEKPTSLSLDGPLDLKITDGATNKFNLHHEQKFIMLSSKLVSKYQLFGCTSQTRFSNFFESNQAFGNKANTKNFLCSQSGFFLKKKTVIAVQCYKIHFLLTERFSLRQHQTGTNQALKIRSKESRKVSHHLKPT